MVPMWPRTVMHQPEVVDVAAGHGLQAVAIHFLMKRGMGLLARLGKGQVDALPGAVEVRLALLLVDRVLAAEPDEEFLIARTGWVSWSERQVEVLQVPICTRMLALSDFEQMVFGEDLLDIPLVL